MSESGRPRNFRTCVICGTHEWANKEKLFFARFPADQSRCKEWLRLAGVEDLVHLPIEKLRTSRYVCEAHFEKKAFNKKGNRLRKLAVPKLKLSFPPLSDEQLAEFPTHKQIKTSHRFPNPVKFPEQFQAWVHLAGGQIVTEEDYVYYSKKVVCDKHFTARDRVRNNRLCKLAVPSLYLPGIDRVLVPVEKAKLHEEYEDNENTPQEATISTCVAIPDESPDSISRDAPRIKSAPSPVAVDFETECHSELRPVSDLSLYEEDLQVVASELPDHETDACTETTDVHECIVCNVCENQIVGFRYVCVQCADWDQCAACEAAGAHAAHAVLRLHRQADVQHVIDAVREAIRCACAEPESVTLHMDVTHEDGFGQVTMDEDNKDDIQLLELPSPVADVTETNPLDQDIPFYAEDSNKKLADINHKETIQPTLTNPTKEMKVCSAFKRNEHNYNKTLECPSEDNVPKDVYRSEHVRVYSKHGRNKLSGVIQVEQQEHCRTTPIQQQVNFKTANIQQQQNSRTAPIQQQQNSRTAPIQHGVDNIIKESYISIKPHNLNLQKTKEIKQISIKHIKMKKLVEPKKLPLRLKLDRTTFLHHKEKLLASGKVKLKRITQAEVDAAIKRQRLHQDTNSDDNT